MKKFDYDFEDVFDKEEKEETTARKNFHIAKCCGNCKFFWYKGTKQRRGFCKLPDPQSKTISKRHREKYDEKVIESEWKKTHCTNICDYHQFRSKYLSIGKVAEWTGKKFNFDGTKHDEE